MLNSIYIVTTNELVKIKYFYFYKPCVIKLLLHFLNKCIICIEIKTFKTLFPDLKCAASHLQCNAISLSLSS
jgi:hypothetical protein